MKLIKTVALIVVGAGLAVGQGAPAGKPAASASSGAKAKPATKPATKPAAKPAAKKQRVAAPAASGSAASAPRGKRDPFISPIVRATGGAMASCTGGGKKCLSVSDIMLQGVVRSQGGWIAVVVNSAKKTYFLRENDPVFNGFVVKITGDSVVFREQATDNVGKAVTREVVKRVAPPV